MIEEIIIAGSGGQGIMLMGKVLATAALRKGMNVTWFPTYGAEVRGGAAYCMVKVSSGDIPSPYIDKADTLIIMNDLSFSKFKQRVKNKGLLLINSSVVNSGKIKHRASSVKQILLPFTEAAIELGNIRVANMVALGAYIAKKEILSKQIVLAAIEEIAPVEKKSLIEINKQAIEKGMELAG